LPWILHIGCWRFRKIRSARTHSSRNMPGIGDNCGVSSRLQINRQEQSRHAPLCPGRHRASVGRRPRTRDFRRQLPISRWRSSITCARHADIYTLPFGQLVQAVAGKRDYTAVGPWGDTPRSGHGSRNPKTLPSETCSSPHGEPFHMTAKLANDSAWKPQQPRERWPNQQR